MFVVVCLVAPSSNGRGFCFYGYRGWHIDHKIPLASANGVIDELAKLCHYTNLQPLWASDNLRKYSKMPTLTT